MSMVSFATLPTSITDRSTNQVLATLESNQACVSARELQSPATPCGLSGAALEVKPLDWGNLADVAIGAAAPRADLLDRVTDPHNVGAILRSAEVSGRLGSDRNAPRHAAPETGALAKAASGALERQPYVRVRNLADSDHRIAGHGLSGSGPGWRRRIKRSKPPLEGRKDRAVALVLGAEGPGLRQKTRETCDALVKIDADPAGLDRSTSQMRPPSPYMPVRITHRRRPSLTQPKLRPAAIAARARPLFLPEQERHEAGLFQLWRAASQSENAAETAKGYPPSISRPSAARAHPRFKQTKKKKQTPQIKMG